MSLNPHPLSLPTDEPVAPYAVAYVAAPPIALTPEQRERLFDDRFTTDFCRKTLEARGWVCVPPAYVVVD